jgi:hypothetical protein
VQIASKDAIRQKIQEFARQLLDLGRTIRPDLERLVSVIHAVPYQQFGTSNVVLRAHFELKLAAFLPDQIRSALEQEPAQASTGQVHTVPMIVDLFEVSCGPARYWAQALKLDNAGLTSEEITTELGTNRATANRAVRYGKALAAAGLSEPFVALTAPPTETGRWRLHPGKVRPDHSLSSLASPISSAWHLLCIDNGKNCRLPLNAFEAVS